MKKSLVVLVNVFLLSISLFFPIQKTDASLGNSQIAASVTGEDENNESFEKDDDNRVLLTPKTSSTPQQSVSQTITTTIAPPSTSSPTGIVPQSSTTEEGFFSKIKKFIQQFIDAYNKLLSGK